MKESLGTAFKVEVVTRTLRDITGADGFRYRKFWLFAKGKEKKAQHPAAG